MRVNLSGFPSDNFGGLTRSTFTLYSPGGTSSMRNVPSGPNIDRLGTQPKAASHLEVSGGEMKVALPRSAAVDLDAESRGGKVITAIPVTMTVSGEQKHGTLRGKINGGGPRLNLRTSSGDIRLSQSPALSEGAR